MIEERATTDAGAPAAPAASPKGRRAGTFGSVFQAPGRPGWYVTFSAEGRKHRRAAGRTEKAARRKLEKVRQYLEDGAKVADVLAHVFGDFTGARLTFRDAAPLYVDYIQGRKKASTLRTHTKRLALILRAPWAAKMLGQVEPKDLQGWIATRQAAREVRRLRPRRPGESLAEYRADPSRWATVTVPGASGATLNRDLSLVSALYRWAIRSGYCDENPVRGVERFDERGRAREVYLTASEAAALVDACGPVLRPLVLAALHTGARRGELVTLAWRSVDLERRVLVIEPENEKAGRGRVVPLTPELAEAMRALRASRPRPSIEGADLVFCLADGEPWRPTGLKGHFKRAVRQCAGIDPAKRSSVTFHTLRHTAASLLVAAGVPLFDVAKILGHSTLAVTMRYAHAAPEAGRAGIDRLAAMLKGGAPEAQRAFR